MRFKFCLKQPQSVSLMMTKSTVNLTAHDVIGMALIGPEVEGIFEHLHKCLYWSTDLNYNGELWWHAGEVVSTVASEHGGIWFGVILCAGSLQVLRHPPTAPTARLTGELMWMLSVSLSYLLRQIGDLSRVYFTFCPLTAGTGCSPSWIG